MFPADEVSHGLWATRGSGRQNQPGGGRTAGEGSTMRSICARCLAVLAAGVWAGGIVASARAAALTGVPATDGWSATGATSLDNGTYIRGAGNFAFDLYATSYALDPTSSLITSTASDTGFQWLAGDQVLGVGGVVVAGEPAANYGWGNVSGDSINSNLTSSVRIVSKFGVSPAS